MRISASCQRAAATLALVTSACAEVDAPPGWTVTDSAGIEIVTNSGGAPEWTLPRQPVLTVGTVDEEGPGQFYQVRDIELLPDGGLVVADQGSEELRFFGPDGSFRGRAGGRGSGPEEFRRLYMVESFGDSLLAYDGGNDRLSVRLPDGGFVRSFRLEWFDGIVRPADVTDDRRVLGITARYMSQLQGSGHVVDTALVSLYDMEGALLDSLLRLPDNARAVHRVGNRQTTLGVPYTTFASIAAVGRGFCHTFGVEPRIRCFDTSGLRRIIRLDLPIRPVTDQDIERYWDRALDTDSESRRNALLRMRDIMPFPDFFPAFSQLLTDDRGRLWVRRYRTPREDDEQWFVLDDGRLTARLIAPEGFRVMDVRGNRMAGVWLDELGVEFVRVYEIGHR